MLDERLFQVGIDTSFGNDRIAVKCYLNKIRMFKSIEQVGLLAVVT